MKRGDFLPAITLTGAFEQFLEGSPFARRTRESYSEDLAPLFAACGQAPITALTVEVVQTFLASQEALAPATYNRRLAALRSFIRWLRTQGWLVNARRSEQVLPSDTSICPPTRAPIRTYLGKPLHI